MAEKKGTFDLECSLRGRIVSMRHVEYAGGGWTGGLPFCGVCVNKFKEAKKQLSGKSDNEIISFIKQAEASRKDAAKAELVADLQRAVDTRTGGMIPELQWEYLHVVIHAAEARESGEGIPTATRPWVEDYDSDVVQLHLQKCGREGWELVSMEPQWFWERVGISRATDITRPRVITAWYCTFKTKVSAK